jgi:CRP-like cAMP-binding protein
MENLIDILAIDSNAKTKHFKKGEIIQSAGVISSLAFYVKKGLLRSYTIDDKGKEHIFMFASEGWIMSDIESHEFNKPSEMFIDCLEDAEIIVFDRKCFKLAKLSPDQLKQNAHLMARRNAVLQRRVIMLMSASAKNRYNQFLDTYPNLPSRVPQRMIASYLGITPQALSTIRGEIARKK